MTKKKINHQQISIFEVIEEETKDATEPAKEAPEAPSETLSEDEPLDLVRDFLTKKDSLYGGSIRCGWAVPYKIAYDCFRSYCGYTRQISEKDIPSATEFFSRLEKMGYPLWVSIVGYADTLENSVDVIKETEISRFFREWNPVRCTLETAQEVFEQQCKKHRSGQKVVIDHD